MGTKGEDECRSHYLETYLHKPAARRPEQAAPAAGSLPKSLGAEQAGYWPRRHEFGHEYDNECETAIANIVLYDDDSPLDRHLKLTMVDIYRRRLDAREARKAVAREFCLRDPQEAERYTRVPELKELWEATQPLARFHSVVGHLHMFEALHKQTMVKAHLGRSGGASDGGAGLTRRRRRSQPVGVPRCGRRAQDAGEAVRPGAAGAAR